METTICSGGLERDPGAEAGTRPPELPPAFDFVFLPLRAFQTGCRQQGTCLGWREGGQVTGGDREGVPPGHSHRLPSSCSCPAGPAASCPAHRHASRCRTPCARAGTPPPAHRGDPGRCWAHFLCAGGGGREEAGRHHAQHWPSRPAPTHADLGELAEVQGAVAVDGRAQVLTVVAAPHRLQLPHAAHVGQARLDLRHVQHLPRHSRLRLPPRVAPPRPAPGEM